MSTIDTESEMLRMMNIAQGNDFTKSPISPCMVMRNGKKVSDMLSVAESTDMKNSRGAAMAACQRDMPCPSFSM